MVNLLVLYLILKKESDQCHQHTLVTTVTERTKFGSKESKNNRKAGLIPVVLYYAGENTHILIDKSVYSMPSVFSKSLSN